MRDQDVLEYRYRRLLRAYPRAWRDRREDEMTATYLEAAPEGARSPGARDAYDVLAGAAKERLRMSGEAGLSAGSRLAGELALTTGAALAAFWFCRVELSPTPDWFTGREVGVFQTGGEPQVHDAVGPVQSLGAVVWIAWMLTAVAATVLNGRWLRRVTAITLAVSVLVVPATLMLPYYRMPLHLLIPQLALGAMALRAGDRRSRIARLAPLAAVLTVAVPLLAGRPWNMPTMYASLDTRGMLALAAPGVLALAAGCVAVMRRRSVGLWAMALTAPVALLMLVAGSLRYEGSGLDGVLYGTAVIAWIVLAGAALLATLVWLQNRYQRIEPPKGASA